MQTYVNFKESGVLDSELMIVIVSWMKGFVHNQLAAELSNDVHVLQISFNDKSYAHVNSDLKINEIKSFIKNKKKVLFFGCSRAGHGAIWFASHDFGSIETSAVAICPQSDYTTTKWIKGLTHIMPESLGGDILRLEKKIDVRIYFSDHPVDFYYKDLLSTKYTDMIHIPYSVFNGTRNVHSAHHLGSYLTTQKDFSQTLLSFINKKI